MQQRLQSTELSQLICGESTLCSGAQQGDSGLRLAGAMSKYLYDVDDTVALQEVSIAATVTAGLSGHGETKRYHRQTA